MNIEVPPRIKGYIWRGSNRQGPSGRRSYGGVGILYSAHLNELWNEKGESWSAIAVNIGKEEWVLVSLYCSHSSKATNKKLFRSVSSFLIDRCQGRGVLIGGDFNAHTHLFEDNNNARGRLLMDFVNQHGLIVLNSTNICKGRYTRGQSTIDYMLCNEVVYRKAYEMIIDDQRNITNISDHNVLILRCEVQIEDNISQVRQIIKMNSKKAATLTNRSLEALEQKAHEANYSTFREIIQNNVNKETKKVSVSDKHTFKSTEIKQAMKERKEANRIWRKARKTRIDEKQAEENYRRAQNAVRSAVEKEEQIRYREISQWILHAPRNERCKRFWRYISRNSQQTRKKVSPRCVDGSEVPREEMNSHLTNVGMHCLVAQLAEEAQPPSIISAPTGITFSGKQVGDIITQFSNKTATGDDQIPAEVLKMLNSCGHEYIARVFNNILNGKEHFPVDWRDGRVSMIEKPNSSRGILTTYRPITVSSVMYRIFMKLLCKHIGKWIEEEEVLGEMQNGFRTDRRGDDNIFLLTSAIELSRKRSRGLICCFLDCSKAYDRVKRNTLWEILESQGMDSRWIEALKAIYTDNRVTVSFDEYRSDKLYTHAGLRQGCPMSPVLFSLYIAELEDRLLWTKCGFDILTNQNGDDKYIKMPGLLYADDLVLFATTYEEMDVLLRVTSEFGRELDLKFNPEKSAIVVFSDNNLGTQKNLSIQNEQLPIQRSYKYLGITISNGNNYLDEQELEWRRMADIALQRLHAQSLWTFNRFEISKIQWKATAVPRLTYGNAVTASKGSKKLVSHLEKIQIEAGRWALGITGFKVANEFIQGEMGWSTFEAREARSKLNYFARISSFAPERWPRAILSMMGITNTYTEAILRLKYLKTRYSCGDIPIEYSNNQIPLLNLYNKAVEKRVQQVMDREWKEGMNLKPSLEIYKQYKRDRGRTSFGIYENGRGSALLALARAGMLPTRLHRSKFQPIHTHCILCGMEEETVQHVIMECTPHHFEREELEDRMGFSEPIHRVKVDWTKKKLEEWERETRKIC